jgi:DNA-directed RNA polymerase subunit M/transcription elongation factor TFIIS
MAEIRDYTRTVLETYFPSHGEEYADEFYVAVQDRLGCRMGWDFYKYRVAYSRLLQSLQEAMNRENSHLKGKLETGEWSFAEALRMDTRLWEPQNWPLFQDKAGEDEQEVREGTFECGRCKSKGVYSKNTSFREQQTRSADEPMTVFAQCHTCGKKWSFSS